MKNKKKYFFYFQFTFYTAQWEENQTKIIQTHINNFGVTETQFITMGMLIIPYFFGDLFSQEKDFGYFSISISNLIAIVMASL